MSSNIHDANWNPKWFLCEISWALELCKEREFQLLPLKFWTEGPQLSKLEFLLHCIFFELLSSRKVLTFHSSYCSTGSFFSAKFSVKHLLLVFFMTTNVLKFINDLYYSAHRNTKFLWNVTTFLLPVCRNYSILDITCQLFLFRHCAALSEWRQVMRWTLTHLIRLTILS